MPTFDISKRANLYDVKNKKWVRTIISWTGVTSSNGRWGLSAPTKGGELDIQIQMVSCYYIKGSQCEIGTPCCYMYIVQFRILPTFIF